MAVLVFIENEEGEIKNSALEVASYGRALADYLDKNVVGVLIGDAPCEILGNYGIERVIQILWDRDLDFDASNYATVIKTIAEEVNASHVILGYGSNSKYISSLLSVKLNAAYISNVVELPKSINPFQVKRSTYSNKAFEIREALTSKVVIGISQNAFGIQELPVECEVDKRELTTENSGLKVDSVEKSSNKISIADAEIVVSGGRGLKGPENWGMIEELAEVLGAATACSKPVSDMGWRPHSEHVGQTGKPVACNLYIAIGISGAIQHLAGVNASKTKVVINSDPEAPFFKAADYGIVGDAFEVVPKLIEEIKKIKS